MSQHRRLHEALERDVRRVGTNLAEYAPDSDQGRALLRGEARTLRSHALQLAHLCGVSAPEIPTSQMRKVLEHLATLLAEDGEPVAADLLRDGEFIHDLLVEFCGEEPRGAGADPYGRPDPQTHPEYWQE